MENAELDKLRLDYTAAVDRWMQDHPRVPVLDDDGTFLAAFQSAGCYLVDLCAEPVDRLDRISLSAACQAGEGAGSP